VLPLLLGLLAIGLFMDSFRGAARICGEFSRPKEPWKEAVEHGLAVSMNALERENGEVGNLPLMDIRGAVFDWRNRDWIIWGDKSTNISKGLPLDALRLSIRAATQELEPPGVDIRPSKGSASETSEQRVTYFGGVESTVVGQWFFDFDYWMKSAALGQSAIPAQGILSYSERLERETDVVFSEYLGQSEPLSRCRFWLKNGTFVAVEDDSALVFKSTPMLVCAERMDNPGPAQVKGGVAEIRFAEDLTTNLHRLQAVAPVLEIEEFAKLLSAVSWLVKIDPYRDLSAWRNSATKPVDTKSHVATLRKNLRIPLPDQADGVRKVCAVELSGGVEIGSRTDFRKAADTTLRELGDAILLARPSQKEPVWSFSFFPSIKHQQTN